MTVSDQKNLNDLTAAIDAKGPSLDSVKYLSRWLIILATFLAITVVVFLTINALSANARITLVAQLMFLLVALTFAAMGALMRTVYNGMRTRLVLEAMKLQGELNSQLHLERLKDKIVPPAVTVEPAKPIVIAPPDVFVLFSRKA